AISLKGPTEVQVWLGSSRRSEVRWLIASIASAGPELSEVGFRAGAGSVTSCSRGSRARLSCPLASRGVSIQRAHARKSRFAVSSTRNTARTLTILVQLAAFASELGGLPGPDSETMQHQFGEV